MIRDENAANAPFADVVASPGNGVAFQWRSAPGAVPNNVNVPGLQAPVWVRLERSGNDFSAFYSSEGTLWTQIGATQTINMSSSALAGLAVTAHNNSALCNVTFTDVSLTAPSPTPAPAGRSAGYNQTRLVSDGVPFWGGGLDGNSNAYSANLLGSSLTAGAVTFHLGAGDGNYVVQAAGQTLALTPGQFSALSFLGTAVNGSQLNHTFIVNYTDGSSKKSSLNLSDWQNCTQGMSPSTWWQAMVPDDGLPLPADWQQ
jgi:hypothetical protein